MKTVYILINSITYAQEIVEAMLDLKYGSNTKKKLSQITNLDDLNLLLAIIY